MRAASLWVVAILAASHTFAGDPVPDVDVTVEQKPCPCSYVLELRNGAPFDRLTLGGDRRFVEELVPERLPTGWVMTREGRRVVLSGAAVSIPTRIVLRAGKAGTKSVDWDVSIAGRTLASRKNVVPRGVVPRTVRNSLQGVVVMPEKVSPGEAIGLRPLPGAALPPGRFVLSGVVMEPLADAEPATEAASLPSPHRRHLDSMVTAPAAGFVLEGPSGATCAELLPLAAVLVGAGSTGACANCKSYFESRSNTAKRAPGGTAPIGGASPQATFKSYFESRSNTANRAPKTPVVPAPPSAGRAPSWDAVEVPASRLPDGPSLAARPGAQHETAKGAIRNLKALFEVAPANDGAESSAAFAIDEKGVKLWELTPPGSSTMRMQVNGRPPSRPSTLVALEATDTSVGCLVTSRDPDVVDLAAAMKAQKPRPERPEGKLDRANPPAGEVSDPHAAIQVGRVPESIAPGTALTLQYVDDFGDVVVDVAAVEGTEVVAPVAPEPPCVTAATAFAQAEDTVCVCGSFPGAAAQAGLWIDERPAGTASSQSTRTIQLPLPASAGTPGRHVWSGDPEAGFDPGCRAWTQVVHIAGAIDSQRLFSSQSTPMRLTVAGTTEKVPIEIRNLTPGIVRVEGGESQHVESSGGTPNVVTRSVEGLVRGDFQIEWSLAADRCPCP